MDDLIILGLVVITIITVIWEPTIYKWYQNNG